MGVPAGGGVAERLAALPIGPRLGRASHTATGAAPPPRWSPPARCYWEYVPSTRCLTCPDAAGRSLLLSSHRCCSVPAVFPHPPVPLLPLPLPTPPLPLCTAPPPATRSSSGRASRTTRSTRGSARRPSRARTSRRSTRGGGTAGVTGAARRRRRRAGRGTPRAAAAGGAPAALRSAGVGVRAPLTGLPFHARFPSLPFPPLMRGRNVGAGSAEAVTLCIFFSCSVVCLPPESSRVWGQRSGDGAGGCDPSALC